MPSGVLDEPGHNVITISRDDFAQAVRLHQAGELEAAARLDVPAHAAPHLPGALAQAWAITPPEGIIVATGSVFLVGELRALALGGE